MSLSTDTPAARVEHPAATQIRRALTLYLESGETDTIALRQLRQLPGGEEALARALSLKAGLAPLQRTGGSVDQYLQWKREEAEEEQRRDEARDAEHP
jgi:hypothetical protein